MPPFLEKLKTLCFACPPQIGGWSAEGNVFEIYNEDYFQDFLKHFFKGNVNTFVRQLHFYGFTKLDCAHGSWSFSHPKFSKSNPDGVFDIVRKTRHVAPSNPQKSEISKLRNEISDLKIMLTAGLNSLRSEMKEILGNLSKDTSTPMNKRKKERELSDENSSKKQKSVCSTTVICEKEDNDLADFMFEGFVLPINDHAMEMRDDQQSFM